MSFQKFSLLFILLFSFTLCTFSQLSYTTSKYKAPFLTIEVAGSFDLPIQDANGNLGDFMRFVNYGTSVGWGAQFNFKFGLADRGDLRPYIFLGYAQLQGSDDHYAYISTNEISNGYPLRGSALFDSTPGTSSIILRAPYVGLGFEYAFTYADKKKRSFIPFIGVEFLTSIITGMYRQTPTNGLPVPFTIKTDVRVGIGAGAGADWRFTPAFGMTFGFKYKLANLIGKKSEFLLEENKMNLLDESSPDLNTHLNQNRSIAYMEFYLGACFFVGKSKK